MMKEEGCRGFKSLAQASAGHCHAGHALFGLTDFASWCIGLTSEIAARLHGYHQISDEASRHLHRSLGQ